MQNLKFYFTVVRQARSSMADFLIDCYLNGFCKGWLFFIECYLNGFCKGRKNFVSTHTYISTCRGERVGLLAEGRGGVCFFPHENDVFCFFVKYRSIEYRTPEFWKVSQYRYRILALKYRKIEYRIQKKVSGAQLWITLGKCAHRTPSGVQNFKWKHHFHRWNSVALNMCELNAT
jgi:hypothetical protein